MPPASSAQTASHKHSQNVASTQTWTPAAAKEMLFRRKHELLFEFYCSNYYARDSNRTDL